MTGLLILLLTGCTVLLFRMAMLREHVPSPHIPRAERMHELTRAEIRAGIGELAAREWAVYRSAEYDHEKHEPKPGAEPLWKGAV